MTSPTPDTLKLTFHHWRDLPGTDDPIQRDISCVAVTGERIFTACDETAAIECLTREEGGYGEHMHIALDEFFDLPGGPHGEMDIEGLSEADGYLWIVGSHSLKRDKPKREAHGAGKALERMFEIDRDPNRYFLGRVPISRETRGAGLSPVAGELRAGCVKLKKKKSKLMKWLKDDELLKPFLDVPSKENGFDIEGLAAKGSRVWLGLRGPVLRGYGVIIELNIKETKPGRLKARKIDGDRRYRRHLVDTRGLGVRDICVDGPDLLLLVGTPLASGGPAQVLRWKHAASDTQSGVIDPSRIEEVMELPYKRHVDHPEGIDLLPAKDGAPKRLIVVYDSPAPERVSSDPASLTADIFPI